MPPAPGRGLVTLSTGGTEVQLVAEIGQYKPFGDQMALGVREYDGVGATTIHDFGFKARRQRGRLSSGPGPSSAGAITQDQLDDLLALLQAWGAAQDIEDDMGNEGTVKAVAFTYTREIGSAAQEAIYSYDLQWRWVTLTKLNGSSYSGG